MEQSTEKRCRRSLGCYEFVEETDIEVVRQAVTSKTKFKKVYWALCFLSGCSLAILFTSIQMRDILTNDYGGMSITNEIINSLKYPNVILCPGSFLSVPTLYKMEIPHQFWLPAVALLGGSTMDPYMMAKWISSSNISDLINVVQSFESDLEAWLKSENLTFNAFSDTIALKCDEVIIACQIGQRERLNPKQCCGSVMAPEAFFTVFGRCFRFDGSINSKYFKAHINKTKKQTKHSNQSNEDLRPSANLWHQVESGPAGGFTLWLNSTVPRQLLANKDGAFFRDMTLFVTDVANSFRMEPIELPLATNVIVNVQRVSKIYTRDSTKFRCQTGLEKGRERCTIEFQMRYMLQKCGCVPYSIASKIQIRRIHSSVLNKDGLLNCTEFSGQNISRYSQITMRNIDHICSPNVLEPKTNFQCENDVLAGRLHIALCQSFSHMRQCLDVPIPSYGGEIWNRKCCSRCEGSILESQSTSVPLSSDVAQFYSPNISEAMVNNTIRATISFTSIRKTTLEIFPIGLGTVLPLSYRHGMFAGITSTTLNGQVSLWIGGSIISLMHVIFFYFCCYCSRKRTGDNHSSCLCCIPLNRDDNRQVPIRDNKIAHGSSIESTEDAFGDVLY